MADGLLTYARKLAEEGPSALLSLASPVLVWEGSPVRPGDDPFESTQGITFLTRPRAGEPLVFELKKNDAKLNAFGLGVTVGRADSNDVPLDDVSVSRFHAYFQKDPRDGWKLYDAESSNGTWVGALRLKGKGGEVVADKSRVRFGDVELTFFEPKSFAAYLEKQTPP